MKKSVVLNVDFAERVEAAASHWVAKLDRGLSKQEEQQLGKWICEDVQHRTVLFQMLEFWDRMDTMHRLADLFPEQKFTEVTARSSSGVRYKVAALAAFFAISAFMILPKSNVYHVLEGWASAVGFNESAGDVYETQVGEYSTVRLSDGSELTLNTNTLVQVKYESNARNFYLSRGEIHIDVSHNPSRPLSVITPENIVQAVGTAFNVHLLDNNKVELIVTEGRVRVSEQEDSEDFNAVRPKRLSNKKTMISKGQKAILDHQHANVETLDGGELEDTLSWREGNIVFRGEELKNALLEVERYTGVRFVVVDDEISRYRIAGLFKSGDVDSLLLALRTNFKVDAQEGASGQIYLTQL